MTESHQSIIQPPSVDDNNDTGTDGQKLLQAYKTCFSTPSGQEVMLDLKLTFGGSYFCAETNENFYREGQRSVYMRIKDNSESNIKDVDYE